MSNPSLREALDLVLAEFRSEVHTSFPARVLAYDAAAQTVDVRPALLREVPSEDPESPWGFERLPDLYAVPIMWPRAGGFAVTFPITEGDWMEVSCAEQCTHVWRDKGDAPSATGLNDPHGLNGCVAKPGYFPDKQRLTDVDTENLVLRSEDNATRIVVSGSTVTLGSTDGAQFIALANKVDAELARLWSVLKGTSTPAWVPSAGDGGAALKAAATTVAAGLASVAATMVRAK